MQNWCLPASPSWRGSLVPATPADALRLEMSLLIQAPFTCSLYTFRTAIFTLALEQMSVHKLFNRSISVPYSPLGLLDENLCWFSKTDISEVPLSGADSKDWVAWSGAQAPHSLEGSSGFGKSLPIVGHHAKDAVSVKASSLPLLPFSM